MTNCMTEFDYPKKTNNEDDSIEQDLSQITNNINEEAIGINCAQNDFSSDIGCHIGKKISDSVKVVLLEKHWSPPSNYTFPHNVVNKKGKPTKKFAQKSHLDKFHWLVLSHKDQGLYCKYCALFAMCTGEGVHNKTPLKRLVKEPLKAFDDLLGEKGALISHERNQYHQMAVTAGKNFLATFHKPELEIANQVCSQRMEQIKQNRECLRLIIKTIILCGRKNIPMRGHRDDGNILNKNSQLDCGSIVDNQEGNFRALLKFHIESGDEDLRKHLETAKSNATYISKTVQNE